MAEEAKVRLLFCAPCGVCITGRPNDAKADIQTHRDNCQTCARTNYVNTLEIRGRQHLKRELVIPADQMDVTMNMVILHDGIIPPGYIVKKAITCVLPEIAEMPGFRRLPMW